MYDMMSVMMFVSESVVNVQALQMVPYLHSRRDQTRETFFILPLRIALKSIMNS